MDHFSSFILEAAFEQKRGFILIMYLFLLLSVSLCTFVWIIRRVASDLSFQYPPTYPGWLPLIGHVHLFFRCNPTNIWSFLKKLFQECSAMGGVTIISIATKNIYLVSNPEEAHTILSSSVEKNFVYDLAKPWLGNGLFTASGMTWKAHRKIMNLAFTQPIMNGLIPIFNTQARCLRERFDAQEKTFDPEPLVSKNNLETICKTSLGLDANDRQDLVEEYGKSLRDIFLTMYERFMKFWLYSDYIFYFSTVKKKQDAIIKGLHRLSTVILEKRKMEIKKMEQDMLPQDPGQFRPLLDTVLELSIKKGLLTEKEVREELDTIIFAGHDTLAMTLSFLLVLIGSDQKRQDKVYQEILEVIGDNDRDVEKEDISKLTYIDCVIKETLRLYPIGPTFPRVATKDVKLKNYVFRAGSSCLIDAWSIHRHSLWGPDPDEFRPERWQDPDKLPIFQKSFAGFGVGNRTCIGKVYAMISLKITLVHLLRKFKVTADVSKLTLKMNSLLRPESGHEITIDRRK